MTVLTRSLGLGPGASVSITGGSPRRPRVLGPAGCRVVFDAGVRHVHARPASSAEGLGR